LIDVGMEDSLVFPWFILIAAIISLSYNELFQT
jgi:hypothetical protein